MPATHRRDANNLRRVQLPTLPLPSAAARAESIVNATTVSVMSVKNQRAIVVARPKTEPKSGSNTDGCTGTGAALTRGRKARAKMGAEGEANTHLMAKATMPIVMAAQR